MKLGFWIMTFIVCLAIGPLAACSRQEPAGQNQSPQETAEQPQEPAAPLSGTASATQVTTGELQSVDLQTKTLTVKDAAGNQQTFSFTDSTDIIGASGTQGLSTQQGSQVTIHHVEHDGLTTAVRIEIAPR